MSTLPDGYTSRDLQQGGTNEYNGAVAGVEAGVVLDVQESYPDDTVHALGSFGDLTALGTTAQGVVLHHTFREWTLDHLDLGFDNVATASRTVEINVYKIPAGTKIADVGATEQIGAEVTFSTSTVSGDGVRVGIELYNLSEQDRRFERGDILYVTLNVTSSTADLGETWAAALGRERIA